MEAANEKTELTLKRIGKIVLDYGLVMFVTLYPSFLKYVAPYFYVYYLIKMADTSQISTTNPVESWHRKLKTGVKGEMHRNYSFQGALLQVDWLENARLDDSKFRSYRSPVCSYFPSLQLEKFPGPIQNLLLEQVNQAREWCNRADPMYERISIQVGKATFSISKTRQPM